MRSKLLSVLALMGFLLAGSVSPAKTFVVRNPDRYIEVIGAISTWAIKDVAQKLDDLSAKSKEPIYLLINSPGGSVAAGMTVVDAMELAKTRGVTLKCFTGVLAASMAYIFMSHCDERYAFHNAKLLFHPISVSLDGARAGELLTSLQKVKELEDSIQVNLQQTLGMDEQEFYDNYYAETFWEADILIKHSKNFLTIVDNVKGIPEGSLFKYSRPMFFLFGGPAVPGSSHPELDKIDGGNLTVRKILERFERGGI